jgi:type II secretory pathway pseudopilin PulG
MTSRRGFTLIELYVLLPIIMLLIAITLSSLAQWRRDSQHAKNAVQLRQIHSAMQLYSNGNNSYFPGIDSRGNRTVENRLHILLASNYLAAQNIASPLEAKTPVANAATRPTTANYSYSLLNLSDMQTRRVVEWKNTSYDKAVVLSDRAIASDTQGNFKSIHTLSSNNSGTWWQGNVGFNDNHVEFMMDPTLYCTSWGHDENKQSVFEDNLFDTVGASMVYSGNDLIIDTSASK